MAASRDRRARERLAIDAAMKALDVCAPFVERAFGGRLEPDGSPFVTCDALTLEHLVALFTRRVCGVRVPGFCASPLAARLRAWVARSSPTNWTVRNLDGTVQPSDTEYGVGLPISEGFASPEAQARYFAEAVPSMRRLRDAAAPDVSPVDRLRLELDEVWPHGAHVRHHRGRCMFAGIARVMRPDTLLDGMRDDGVCHVDDFPVGDRAGGVFSANVYVKVPARGGGLDVWNVSPTKWDLLRNYSAFKGLAASFSPESQRAIRAALPPPVRVEPREGDLILIDTGRPHAVRGFDAGERITLQCFVQYRRGEPVVLMS